MDTCKDEDIEIPPDDKLPEVVFRNWLSDRHFINYLDKADYECLIDGWLEKEGLGWVVAKSNVGKTNFIIDMAYHIASGFPWYGNKVKQGHVYYFALEGGKKGIAKRVMSIATAKSQMFDRAIGRIHIDRDDFDLSQDGDTDRIILEMRKTRNNPSMIIYDTLSEANQGARENNIDDMKAVFRRLRRIVKECNCFVMVLHHFGKNIEAGGRGGSNQFASLDTEITLEETEDGFSARDTKQRDLPKHPKPLYFQGREIELQNEGGKKFTGIIIVEAEASSPRHKTAQNFVYEVIKEFNDKKPYELLKIINTKGYKTKNEKPMDQPSLSRYLNLLLKDKRIGVTEKGAYFPDPT